MTADAVVAAAVRALARRGARADGRESASLPKTRSGKIVRRYLKAQEMGEDPGDLSTLAD